MIQITKPLGKIEISNEFFSSLVGNVATNCFGVVAMSTSGAVQGLKSLIFKKELLDRGVKVRTDGSKLIIDLHIIVTFGVNIKAISKSIVNKVKYSVEEITGFEVAKVNVFIDGSKA